MDREALSPQTGEPMRCPSCGNRLIEVERTGVLIDACAGCRGVWLDRGELDKILVEERRMASADPDEDFLREVEGRREREPRAAGGGAHQVPPKKHRRRGFLEDLLDFG